ncbi:MAG: type IX secretion system membrane protein PorP/SprF [Spirosomataceae bacterium]
MKIQSVIVRVFSSYLTGWLCLTMAFSGKAVAQQLPQYAQYLQNHFLLNPALAGIESYADARLGYRQQWAGLDDAPRTFYLTAHLPIANPDFTIEPASPRFSFGRSPNNLTLPDAHGGMGFTILRDQTGPWSRFSLSASGAYHYPLGDAWQLSAGLSAGITQHTLDFDQIRLANAQDPVVSTGKVSAFRPDLQVGVWLYSPDFFGGFSVQQLWAAPLKFKRSDYDWQGKIVPHYLLTAGYRLSLTDDWDFVPSILFKKAVASPLSWDLNLKFNYQNDFWLGLSYRQQSALIGWVGVRVAQKMMVNYTYETTLSSLHFTTRGSHELSLGVSLGNRYHYSSPRSFW